MRETYRIPDLAPAELEMRKDYCIMRTLNMAPDKMDQWEIENNCVIVGSVVPKREKLFLRMSRKYPAIMQMNLRLRTYQADTQHRVRFAIIDLCPLSDNFYEQYRELWNKFHRITTFLDVVASRRGDH